MPLRWPAISRPSPNLLPTICRPQPDLTSRPSPDDVRRLREQEAHTASPKATGSVLLSPALSLSPSPSPSPRRIASPRATSSCCSATRSAHRDATSSLRTHGCRAWSTRRRSCQRCAHPRRRAARVPLCLSHANPRPHPHPHPHPHPYPHPHARPHLHTEGAHPIRGAARARQGGPPPREASARRQEARAPRARRLKGAFGHRVRSRCEMVLVGGAQLHR
jgi:hypothetical protein